MLARVCGRRRALVDVEAGIAVGAQRVADAAETLEAAVLVQAALFTAPLSRFRALVQFCKHNVTIVITSAYSDNMFKES